FEKLGRDPVKTILDLNEKLHFLTEATYSQIEALKAQGRDQEAATLAMKTYSDVVAERTADVEENLGNIEKAWQGIVNVGKAALDMARAWGREKGPRDELLERINQIRSRADRR